VSFRTSQW